MSFDLEILKSLLLEFEQVVLCKFHTPPPLFPRDQRTAFTATTASAETVSKMSRAPSPRMVLALHAGLVSQGLLGHDPFGFFHNSQNKRKKQSREL